MHYTPSFFFSQNIFFMKIGQYLTLFPSIIDCLWYRLLLSGLFLKCKMNKKRGWTPWCEDSLFIYQLLQLSAMEILMNQIKHFLWFSVQVRTQCLIFIATEFTDNAVNHCRTKYIVLFKNSPLLFQTIGRRNAAIR